MNVALTSGGKILNQAQGPTLTVFSRPEDSMNRFRMAVPIVALALMLTACPAGNTSTTPNPSASAGGSGGGNAGATIEVTSLWGGAEASGLPGRPRRVHREDGRQGHLHLGANGLLDGAEQPDRAERRP